MHEQAAHGHANVDERGLAWAEGAGLDGVKTEVVASQCAGAAAAETGKAFALGLFHAGDDLAVGVGLVDLYQRVVHRLAGAVQHAAGDADVLALGMRLGEHRCEQALEVVAVLRGRQAVRKVRADGL